MAEAKLAPNLPQWMVDHANRYISSGGNEGHIYTITPPGYSEMHVPSLLLTTTGRKSGEKYIFPLFYGEEATATSWSRRRAAHRAPQLVSQPRRQPRGRSSGRDEEVQGQGEDRNRRRA